MELKLEAALESHIDGICDLVNLAYRGEKGWTKETDLVSGNRLDENEIQQYLLDRNAHLLVAIDNNNEIVSCICIEEKNGKAYIGLFSVHPKLQGVGVGRKILSQAENYACTTLNINKYVLTVISQRKELIAYYERRGYVKIGESSNYPENSNTGVPFKNGLTIEYLEKHV